MPSSCVLHLLRLDVFKRTEYHKAQCFGLSIIFENVLLDTMLIAKITKPKARETDITIRKK